MAPNEVIFADVNELVRIQSARSTYRKNEWYSMGQISPPHHNLLSMLDKQDRKERKRKITPGVGSWSPGFPVDISRRKRP